MNTVIEVENLYKSYGNIKAVNGISFSVSKGEIFGMLGPNGAGKTTFFNLLSGHLRPTSGGVLFMGKNVRKMPAYERCRLGIGRSFQLTNIFPDLTAFENVRVAAQSRKRTFSFWSNWSKYRDVNEKADEILNRIGLYEKRDHLASTLAYGEQRYLEIGITLATDPLVLLLDEPTSGMSPEESRQVADFVKELSQDVDILLVEHDMHFVMTISDKVTCLENGTVIACDAPAEIRNNSRVQACYLREKIC